MGRFMCCGIATKISINSKVSIKENKEDILNRIKCVFDLKYYDIVEDDSDKHICLYLKEDIFNKELKDLLRELAEIKSFWWSMYENFEAIERKYNDSDREKKQKVIDYLDNNFNSYVEKEQEQDERNDYTYFFENRQSTLIGYENYFYCTDMCDDTLFNDNLDDDYDILEVSPSYLSLYMDVPKTYSENIYSTLRFLNHFLRTSLKSNLRNTLIFGLLE